MLRKGKWRDSIFDPQVKVWLQGCSESKVETAFSTIFILHNYSKCKSISGMFHIIDIVYVFVIVIVIVFAYFKANQFEGCSTTCNQSVLKLPVTL